ncbi:leucine-zipper-like transcriptional regulator 1 [Anaeramoeba flamelloides]|uniref:Leucine-zipper-like transcriptional regulator 1 n=1 Tax=Anaeramoeba flamelloides TaxID=1746091 RepID=A0ABQ8XVM1_9EUKA|nr:leucine-zipper-like transcriptional regulator 1 [Anaeramoeba flamelloides]
MNNLQTNSRSNKRKRSVSNLRLSLQNKPTPNSIRSVLESGCDPNEIYEDGTNPLILSLRLNLPKEIIQVLLNFGAELYCEEMITTGREVPKQLYPLIRSHFCINYEFYSLLVRNDLVDSEYHKIKFNQFWANYRMRNTNLLNKSTNWKTISQKLDKRQFKIFMVWVYCGLISNFKEFTTIIELLNFSEIIFEMKSGKAGLMKDLNSLYFQNTTKDLELILLSPNNNQEIIQNLLNGNSNIKNEEIEIENEIDIYTENEKKKEKEKEKENKNENEENEIQNESNTVLNFHQIVLVARSKYWRKKILNNINNNKNKKIINNNNNNLYKKPMQLYVRIPQNEIKSFNIYKYLIYNDKLNDTNLTKKELKNLRFILQRFSASILSHFNFELTELLLKK